MAFRKPRPGKSLAEAAPAAAAEWDEGRNAVLHPGVVPGDVPTSSKQSAWFRCLHGHRHLAVIGNRARGAECLTCFRARQAGVGPNEDLSLKSRNPRVFAMLDPAGNADVDLGNVLPGSHQVLNWRCPSGHRFSAPVCDLVRSEGSTSRGCRECKYEMHGDLTSVPGPGQSLLDSNESFLDEWDDPADMGGVSKSSGRQYRWKCRECGYQWSASPHSRSKGTGCMPCGIASNALQRSMCAESDSIAVLHPEHARDWDVAGNAHTGRAPANVSPGSDLVVSWTCRECPATWVSSVYSRIKFDRTVCNACSPVHTSRAEANLRTRVAQCSELVGVDPSEGVRVPVRWGVKAPRAALDIYGEAAAGGQPVAVEYDGSYWHGSTANFDTDKRKTSALLQAGYLVVRVREGELPFHEMAHPNLLQLRFALPQDAATIPEDFGEVAGRIDTWLREKAQAETALNTSTTTASPVDCGG